MGTYESPGRRPLNTKGRALGNGITRMVQSFANDKKAQRGKEARDAAEASSLLHDRSLAAEKRLMQGYNSIEKDIETFEGGLSNENKNVMHAEITGAVDGIGQELTDWLRDNPDASYTQRELKTQEAIGSMTQLQKDLTHLNAARQQYLAARDLKPGEEGSLVANFNPQLIKFFEAQERNDPNTHLTRDDNGNWRFSVAAEEDIDNALGTMGENDILEFTSFDMTDWGNKAEAGDGYFKTVEEPDYTIFQEQIDDPGMEGVLWDKGKEGEKIYKKDAIKDFYTAQGEFAEVEGQPITHGGNILSDFVDDDDKYSWHMFYGEETEPGGPYSNQIENYDQGILQNNILDGFLATVPEPPKPKPKPRSTPASTPSSSSKTEKSSKTTYPNWGRTSIPQTPKTQKQAIDKGWFDPKTGWTTEGKKKMNEWHKKNPPSSNKEEKIKVL